MLPYFFGFDAQKRLIFAPHLPGLQQAYVLPPQMRRSVHMLGGCMAAGGIDLGTMIGNAVAGFPVAMPMRIHLLRIGAWVAFILVLYVLAALYWTRRGTLASQGAHGQASANRLRLPMMRIVLGIFLMLPAYIGLHMAISDGAIALPP